MELVSGGQSGADQGGLFAARRLKISTSGFAPKDFLTDVGPAPRLKGYGLVEMPTRSYPARTRKCVAACDVCVWFGSPSSRGGVLTGQLCRELDKPLIVIDPDRMEPEVVAGWVRELAAKKSSASVHLMCAGNRESVNPGIGAKVEAFMKRVLEFLTG